MTAPARAAQPGEPVEGWMAEKPYHARRYHYIVDTMAICREYGFYRGELTPDSGSPERGREDCATCFRRLRRRVKEGPRR